MQTASRLFKRALEGSPRVSPAGAPVVGRQRRIQVRQVYFVYRPASRDDVVPIRTDALQRWLQSRAGRTPSERTSPTPQVAGVMSNMDKFHVAYAVRSLKSMQAHGFCGRVAINLTVAGLWDPLLPVFVVSQMRQRRLALSGIRVVLSRR